MISDERLNQLIEYQNKWCAECELDDTEHLPGDGLWDTHNALIELAHYRRTFAKIEEMLKEGESSIQIESDDVFYATYHIGEPVHTADHGTGTSPFAALSALAESVSKGAGQ